MKFGRKLSRTMMIMPLNYREQLFLDYKMLKEHIKLFVQSSISASGGSGGDEPAASPVSGLTHDHGWVELGSRSQYQRSTATTNCGLEDIEDLDFDDAFLSQPRTWSNGIVQLGTWPSTAMACGIFQPLLFQPQIWSNGIRLGWLKPGIILGNSQPMLVAWSNGMLMGWPSTAMACGNQGNSQPMLTAPREGVEAGLERPVNCNSGIDEKDEAFLHELFRSTGDNTDVHLRYQVTIFKRMLDAEFQKINKLFVARLQHNTALMMQLDLMRREEEAKQNYLHSSILSWDVGMLKRIRWWMANLFVDFRTLEYSSKINYEASVKILKKHDRHTGSNLRWNYVHHVEAQDFYVLLPEFGKLARQCGVLMSLGAIQQLPTTEEEFYRDYTPLDLMCSLLDHEIYLGTTERSSTPNAQSLHPPASV